MSMSTHDEGGVDLLNAVIPFFFRVGSIVVGLVAVAAGVLYAKQDALLYFPEIGGIPRRPRQNPRKYRSPQEHQLPFETHMIRCEDGVSVHSWLLLQPNSKSSPTLVFFHGNAGNIGLRLPNAIQMYSHLKANILMVEYRGFGDSDDAKIDEKGLKLDAEAALRFISTHQLVDTERVFVFGRSLGGAVGFHLAQYAERKGLPLAGLIVENTFLSISHMVDHLMPYVALLKPLVLRIGWNSYEIVPTVKTPILFLAGANDQLVPHAHMKQLYRSSKSSVCARMHVIKDGTHNETWMQGGGEYWQRIRSFFSEVFTLEHNHGSTRSVTSLDSISLDDRPSVSVSMGEESVQAGSIPIMPRNIVGMAREASKAPSKSETNPKDKKDM